jgi:hypothetical protein
MPTANDKAWEYYIAADHLLLDGKSYEIDAAKLKEITGREPPTLKRSLCLITPYSKLNTSLSPATAKRF